METELRFEMVDLSDLETVDLDSEFIVANGSCGNGCACNM